MKDILALPREVESVAEYPRCFLRRVESHRVLRLDEVDEKLRVSVRFPRFLKARGSAVATGNRGDTTREVEYRIERDVAKLESPVLYRLDPCA